MNSKAVFMVKARQITAPLNSTTALADPGGTRRASRAHIVAGAHVMTNTHLCFSAYDTLCLICAELNVDLADVADSDFDSASGMTC